MLIVRSESVKNIEVSLRDKVYEYAKKKYGTKPEYLWARYPDYAVLRHKDNQKWYGIIMNIQYDKIDRLKTGEVDVLNIKLDDVLMRDLLVEQEGYYVGYHISRGNWLSIVLDETVDIEDICNLLSVSYIVTASRETKQKLRPPKEWLVPSNPKYYDVITAFEETDIIDWKQGKGIKKGDTVFLYVGAPISAVLYKCEVTETDIPYRYNSEGLTITKLMRIKRKKKYEQGAFTFDRLKTEFGIFAVRGPRGVPNSLSKALNED